MAGPGGLALGGGDRNGRTRGHCWWVKGGWLSKVRLKIERDQTWCIFFLRSVGVHGPWMGTALVRIGEVRARLLYGT